jgi:hypothetical protein
MADIKITISGRTATAWSVDSARPGKVEAGHLTVDEMGKVAEVKIESWAEASANDPPLGLNLGYCRGRGFAKKPALAG